MENRIDFRTAEFVNALYYICPICAEEILIQYEDLKYLMDNPTNAVPIDCPDCGTELEIGG